MTDYEQLAKALRCIELKLSCNECEYGKWSESGEAWSCDFERRDTDAADAIEELQKTLKAVQKNSEINFRMWKEAQSALEAAEQRISELEKELEIWTARSFEGKIASMAFINLNLRMEISKLKAQLPKRGKWIWDDKRCIYVCSVCGSPKVRENMDRQIIKEQAYCYHCGAKMEVRDGD